MPFILFLLLLVQKYSARGTIKASALFVSLRKLDSKISPDVSAEIDLSLPYVILCIVSASSGNQRTIWFFILFCLLLAVILWSFRPKRYRLSLWTGLLLLSFTMAYAGQLGLRDLQRSFESTIMDIFEQFLWRYRDPDRATTAIGSIGRLKLSDQIVLRVKPERKLTQTLLLREAGYRNYNYGIWSNSSTDFTVIDRDIVENLWTIADAISDKSVFVSTYMSRVTGVIPLPYGTNAIRGVGRHRN